MEKEIDNDTVVWFRIICWAIVIIGGGWCIWQLLTSFGSIFAL